MKVRYYTHCTSLKYSVTGSNSSDHVFDVNAIAFGTQNTDHVWTFSLPQWNVGMVAI